MALTTRGKALIAGGAVVAVLGGGVAALALSGDNPVVLPASTCTSSEFSNLSSCAPPVRAARL